VESRVEFLLKSLHNINKISNEEWMASLEERKLKELEFHDSRRKDKNLQEVDSYEKYYGNKKYYTTVNSSRKYMLEWIEKNAPGKVFLDYACGNGEKAIYAAQCGAKLSIGIDISSVSIDNARKAAEENGVKDNIFFCQGDAENTKLPDRSIDTILCSGMLHHLDLSYAFPEMRRILAPDGKILAIEALGYNPLIQLYRNLTPQMRTEWEKHHILNFDDLKFAKRFFNIGDIKFWHILAYIAAHIPFALAPLNALDHILTKIPGLRLMAWIFTFELLSKESSIK
jgi:ubiquinone/menaquinone biosynthesis C-methylase UbiE